jgi:hypothetical protein
MSKDQPLWHRLYFDAAYAEVARLIGYAGFQYRELADKLEPLYQRFGKAKVESVVYQLASFDGQMTVKPPPLAKVMLRAEVKSLCWQLLGVPPDHPQYELMQQPEPLPNSWDIQKPAARKEARPRSRKKKSA